MNDSDALPFDDREAQWRLATEILEAFLAKAGDGPWLFHGTSVRAATQILVGGFEPRSEVWSPGPGNPPVRWLPCVFWTDNPDYAVIASSWNRPEDDGGPAVLVAKFDDVIASGDPVPDTCMWEIETNSHPAAFPADWRASLEKFRSVAVVDCQTVPDLAIVTFTGVLRPAP